ncbi:MAG: UvrD-helicase domain-containing protein [Saprospiraceae bacterium]|jgi:ATP-dependent helicase/nuclease subunit A|nr:UvrD-helicase domain-containing protein [Saprospiraceae bacterium]
MPTHSKLETQHSKLNLTILSAGAGSGKTYTLTRRMVELMKSGVRARGIVATTFTQKAAAELQERVRARLLEDGMTEAANELAGALIGTVHSIGVRLLQRFAFEAGVSPLVEIIADSDQQRLFNESLAQVLTEERIESMNLLADRLGLTKKTDGEPYDWRRDIRELTDVARANNFGIDVLETSKKRSREAFEQLLPPAQSGSEQQWNNRLIALIDQTVAALDANEADDTKVTREAAEELRNLQNQLKWRGELYWHEWVKISKVKVGAKSRDLFEDLQSFARSHDEHPRFREDVGRFIEMVFDIAADALGEYEQYKKKRGLIDYTDMETYVSRLLRIESVRETLRPELDLLLVDEFQDTSPIQLDIFLQLSRLARHSIWVGDPKQSIYGFRGAEPALMQAIISATGGVRPENVLGISWRSRPDIVYAVNAIFTRAFSDMPVEQVALEPANPTPDPSPKGEGGYTPTSDRHSEARKECLSNSENISATRDVDPLPFGGGAGGGVIHWHFRNELDHRKVPGSPWMENCIAAQIQVLLDRQTPVWSKKRDSTRPARPGDIAVLCRSNRGCELMAEALHRAGLKAAIARAGLLETLEGKLVLACLKYLLIPSDALSIAEILALTGAKTLDEIVGDRLDYLHRQQQGEDPGRWAMEYDVVRQLFELRPRTADLSASETLNFVLDELDLRRVAVRFGNAAQRLDNLDRLRRYALDYESACQRLHAAASLGGFLLWLNELGRSGKDYQGSGESPDAVNVLTYHRSKGLEYPVCICHNLNQPAKENVWGINLVSERAEPDLENILGHRWLRFWKNPYADQIRGTRLDETLHQSEVWAQASKQALAEEARLLYVGLTRARDYLVLPTNAKGTPWLNRVFHHGDENIPTLDPDSSETPFIWNGNVVFCENEPLYKPKDFAEAQYREISVPYHEPRKGSATEMRLPRRIDPTTEWPAGFQFSLSEPIRFADMLEFKGDFRPDIGKAAKAILVADSPALPREKRLALAALQLQNRGLEGVVNPEQALRQAEAFRQFVKAQFSPQQWLPKFPVDATINGRLLSADVDLLLENEHTIVVCLFAKFAEGMKKWKDQAKTVAPLAGWLNGVLPAVFPGKIMSYWVVFPVEGQIVQLIV